MIAAVRGPLGSKAPEPSRLSSAQSGSPRRVCEFKVGLAERRCIMAGSTQETPVGQKRSRTDAQTDNKCDEEQDPFSKLSRLGWWW